MKRVRSVHPTNVIVTSQVCSKIITRWKGPRKQTEQPMLNGTNVL